MNSRQSRILHVFDHACNLINERREVLSIVAAEIGDGPFNLMVKENILFNEHCDAESSITIDNNSIRLGDLSIDTKHAQIWNPYPDWENLHSNIDHVFNQLRKLSVIAQHSGWMNYKSLTSNLSYAFANADIPASVLEAKLLAGLGQGLTPSGDDFIVGALYASWIIHPLKVAQTLAAGVANTASELTTSLSAAWIRSAGRGEAGVRWHEFFDALVSSDVDQIYFAMNNILAVGETSGADALAGFINTCMAWAIEVNIQHE